MILTPTLERQLLSGELKGEDFLKMLLEDFELYADACLKIQTKAGDLIPFRLNRAQQVFLEICQKQLKETGRIRLVIVKGRQMGISTFIEAILFRMAQMMPNHHVKVIAHDTEAVVRIFDMAKRFYKYLPDFLRPMTKFNNRQELTFANPSNDPKSLKENPGLDSSFGVYTAGAKGAGRSATLRGVHASEVPHWGDTAAKTMLGLLNSVPKAGDAANGTMVFIESTAKGVGDYFYRRYMNARAAQRKRGVEDLTAEAGFWPVFLPWYLMDEYVQPVPDVFVPTEAERKLLEEEQTDWSYVNPATGRKTLSKGQIMFMRQTLEVDCEGDSDMFHQEYPLTDDEAFVASGACFFDVPSVIARRKTVMDGLHSEFTGDIEWQPYSDELSRADKKDPLLIPLQHGPLTIWKKPETDTDYVYFADVGQGVRGGDESVCTVFNLETGYQCAVWAGILAPDKFGDVIYKLGKYYNFAYGTPETNAHGISTLDRLRALRYPSLYLRPAYDKHTVEATEKEGWQTNLRTRPLMLDTFKKMFRDNTIVINDRETLDQMLTFVMDDNGKFQAQEGCHDDRVFAAAGAARMLVEHNSPLRRSRRASYRGPKRTRPEARFDPVTGYPV